MVWLTPPWLVNAFWAMPIIALFVTWKQLGFYILLYLAALQNIPRELYESAKVDGASPVRTFFAVTVPGVRAATTLVVILATIVDANFFTKPYLLIWRGRSRRSVDFAGPTHVPDRHRAKPSRLCGRIAPSALSTEHTTPCSTWRNLRRRTWSVCGHDTSHWGARARRSVARSVGHRHP